MRKVIFRSAVSMDGFIEGAGGELGWLTTHGNDPWPPSSLSEFDTLFYGRRAYEKVGMPEQGSVRVPFEEDSTYMRKYVFSRTRRHVSGNAMIIASNIEGEVRRIRQEHGKNILVCGGADILRTLASLDLVDEYHLIVFPVLLGSGTPLFQRNTLTPELKLLEKQRLRSGLVHLHYIPISRINHHYHDSRGI